ncbi:MAG: DUF3789 domain-containing protein [Ruminococcus sp.]|jgi:hypothetical protein|nr:DUF3789 domain-containing protein [Ruminococcus sp.]
MLGFLIGIIVGGIIGVIIMALMNVASDADRHSDNIVD